MKKRPNESLILLLLDRLAVLCVKEEKQVGLKDGSFAVRVSTDTPLAKWL